VVPVSVVARGRLVVRGSSPGPGRVHAAGQRGAPAPTNAQVPQDPAAAPPARRGRRRERRTEKAAQHRAGPHRRSGRGTG